MFNNYEKKATALNARVTENENTRNNGAASFIKACTSKLQRLGAILDCPEENDSEPDGLCMMMKRDVIKKWFENLVSDYQTLDHHTLDRGMRSVFDDVVALTTEMQKSAREFYGDA